ncbi:MAG: ABC transporter permease [Peptococcaceae bacterium]|jgi:simple sugar transport system permease protein|nr:ABC transporter permease [Peptococcaceae bacterium]
MSQKAPDRDTPGRGTPDRDTSKTGGGPGRERAPAGRAGRAGQSGGGGGGGARRQSPAPGGRLLRLLDDDRTSPIALPLFSVFLTLIAASLLLLALGRSPLTAMAAFLRGSGFMIKPSYASGQNIITDLLSFLGILAPMLLAALGVIVSMKAGMFNIGIAGQMLASGFIATVLVGYSDLGSFIAKPLVILIGAAVGAAMGALVGFLKYRFNIHEVVSTIMFNYITSYITGFYINTYYRDIITRSARVCSTASRLTITGIAAGSLRPTIPLGILIALAGVFIVRFLLDRTTVGFELKAVGLNRDAAQYAGIRVGRSIVLGMLISGLLAGLAGVTYYLGYYNSIVPKELASLGYDAIAVSLLGNSSPVASIFASGLITIFQKGSIYMSSTVGVPKEIASVITGILLLFSACGTYIRYQARRRREKLAEEEAKLAAASERGNA